jgi:hypothetical protein
MSRTVTAIVIIVISVVACDGLKAQSISQPSGPPGPDETHRVLMNLGIGGYVAVKSSSGKTMRGHIRAIADDHFALLVDGTAVPADIRYGELQWVVPVPELVPRVSRAPSLGKTLAIVGAAAYFGFMMVCSQPARC